MLLKTTTILCAYSAAACRQETTKLVADKGKLVEVVERSGIVPNGTGFAVTTGAVPDLDGTHLVVGEVVEGMDLVRKLDQLPVVKNNTNSPFFQVSQHGPASLRWRGCCMLPDVGVFRMTMQLCMAASLMHVVAPLTDTDRVLQLGELHALFVPRSRGASHGLHKCLLRCMLLCSIVCWQLLRENLHAHSVGMGCS